MNKCLLAPLIGLLLTTAQSNAQYWRTNGNNDTSTTSFLGNRNAMPLRIYTNNLERLSIGATGNFNFNNNQLFLSRSTRAIGIGTGTPNASSILDITSTTKGVLLPRLTRAQRNLIASPAPGLLLYQTDNQPGLYYFQDTWKRFAPDSGLVRADLSNLTSVSINEHLVPASNGTRDLGRSDRRWNNLYLNGNLNVNGTNVRLAHPNTTVGTLAGDSLMVDAYNSAFGYAALRNTTTGERNVAVGYQSMFYNKTGNHNVAVGSEALHGNRTQDRNVGVGFRAGRWGANWALATFIGAESWAYSDLTNVTAVGAGAVATASNQMMLGNTSLVSVRAAGNYVIYSDGRFKKNVAEDVPGLPFIKQLRPVTYRYDIRSLNSHIEAGRYPSGAAPSDSTSTSQHIARIKDQALRQKEKIVYTGFIAQEVEQVAKELKYDFSGIHKPQNEQDVYGLSYADFVAPLVKSVQELSAENEKLKAENEKLHERLTSLEELASALDPNPLLRSKAWMKQNTPNPVKSSTTIQYFIPAHVRAARILVTDAKARQLKIFQVQGSGTITFSAGTLPSGSYTYSLVCDGKTINTKKMIIAR